MDANSEEAVMTIFMEIKEKLGIVNCLTLLTAVGGTRQYISNENKKIIGAIGAENAALLVDLFGCGWLDLPSCSGMVRRFFVFYGIEKGLDARSIVKTSGVDDSTVYRIKNRIKRPGSREYKDLLLYEELDAEVEDFIEFMCDLILRDVNSAINVLKSHSGVNS